MQPFLRWAGGKRWLTESKPEWFEVPYQRYIEPFLGGGAVLFSICPEAAIVSDLNSELIATYEGIRDRPLLVDRYLRKHDENHSKEYYYATRSKSPRSTPSRAARFVYLNRTCFNGIYRVNLNGEFNVPKGSKDKVIMEEDDFCHVSKILEGIDLRSGDFEPIVNEAQAGDLLYIDPPYTVQHNNNNFIKYNENIFSWDDQVRLAACVKAAAQRGAYVMVSNAKHECIAELYNSQLWSHLSVSRWSVIGSENESRKLTEEYVISNYINSDGSVSEPRTD